MPPAERIIVECPHCGATSHAWAGEPADLGIDPELGDPGRLVAEASATCPSCGRTACCTGLAAERELYRT